MAETWNKKEREKKKKQLKREKSEKKQERKENPKSSSLDDMMAYIDENGNLTSTPPDLRKVKKMVKLEDIEIGVPRQREIDPSELIRTGTITFFNNEKGYGFIKDDKSKESVFVHINALKDPVQENSKVTFEVEMGHKGPNAVNVRLQPT